MNQRVSFIIIFLFFSLTPHTCYSFSDSYLDSTAPKGCGVEIMSRWDLEGKGDYLKDGCSVFGDDFKKGERCRCAKFRLTNTTNSPIKVTGITFIFLNTNHSSGAALPDSVGSPIIKPGKTKIVDKMCMSGPSPIQRIWCTQDPVSDSDRSGQDESKHQRQDDLEPEYQGPARKSKLRQSPDGTWVN